MIWLDKSAEAPGVQGLGAPFRVFWVWAEGDGNSPAGLNRCEYTGEYYKVRFYLFIFPFIPISSSSTGICQNSTLLITNHMVTLSAREFGIVLTYSDIYCPILNYFCPTTKNIKSFTQF